MLLGWNWRLFRIYQKIFCHWRCFKYLLVYGIINCNLVRQLILHLCSMSAIVEWNHSLTLNFDQLILYSYWWFILCTSNSTWTSRWGPRTAVIPLMMYLLVINIKLVLTFKAIGLRRVSWGFLEVVKKHRLLLFCCLLST